MFAHLVSLRGNTFDVSSGVWLFFQATPSQLNSQHQFPYQPSCEKDYHKTFNKSNPTPAHGPKTMVEVEKQPFTKTVNWAQIHVRLLFEDSGV